MPFSVPIVPFSSLYIYVAFFVAFSQVHEYLCAVTSLQGQASDIRHLTNNCVSNVICNIILGHRFELDDEEFKNMLAVLNDQVGIC